MTVYLLIYDEDNGSREDCNIFYSPIEVFADAATREKRISLLSKINPDIGYREENLELQTTADFEIPYQFRDDDDDEDDEDDANKELYGDVEYTDPSQYLFYAYEYESPWNGDTGEDDTSTLIAICPEDYFRGTGFQWDQGIPLDFNDKFGEVLEGLFEYEGTVEEARAELLSMGLKEDEDYTAFVKSYMSSESEPVPAPVPEVDNGIQFSDELMNLSVEELFAALSAKWETDEQEELASLNIEPELVPEDCYYCAFTIDNPWDGEEDTSIVVVIPKNKFDGIVEPALVDIPYGLVPVVMTEAQSGAFIYRGLPADAKTIMDRYGFVENSNFHKFCEDME